MWVGRSVVNVSDPVSSRVLSRVRWQASPAAGQGMSRCCPGCCPGPGCCPRGTSATLLLFFLLFSFFRSKRALVDWYAFKPRLGLVLASFFVLPVLVLVLVLVPLLLVLLLLALTGAAAQRQGKSQKCIMTARAQCFADFYWRSRRKKYMWTARACAQCFLDFSHFLRLAGFSGERSDSLQKTMLVM